MSAADPMPAPVRDNLFALAALLNAEGRDSDGWERFEGDLAGAMCELLALAHAGRLPRLRAELLCHALAALHEAAREALT